MAFNCGLTDDPLLHGELSLVGYTGGLLLVNIFIGGSLLVNVYCSLVFQRDR